MEKVKLEQLLPFIDEAFACGKTFRIPVTGVSMLPLLVQGRDYAVLKRAEGHLKTGDVPLYRRADGAFVLHRVVGFDGDSYIMCGDNQFLLEYGIGDGNIIGVACEFIIDGKTVDTEADEEYIKYKNKYTANIKTRYPVRRLRSKAAGAVHKFCKR